MMLLSDPKGNRDMMSIARELWLGAPLAKRVGGAQAVPERL